MKRLKLFGGGKMSKTEDIKFELTKPKKRYYFDLPQIVKRFIEKIVDKGFMKIGEWRKLFDKTEWWTYEQLKDYQLERLKIISKGNIQTWEDFYKLPLMTKEDVRKWTEENEGRILLYNKNLTKHQTSGSTGEPLRIYGPWFIQGMKDACFERAWRWCGWDGKKPILRLTAGEPEWGWYDWLRNVKPLNYRKIEQKHLDFVYNKKPWIIHGGSGAIRELTTTMIKQGQEDILKEINVYLMSEDVKKHTEELQKYYKGVYAGYGLAELCTIASQCYCQNYHVNMETAVVESMGGEIVVTDLLNDVTPLIRYRTGDKGKIMHHEDGKHPNDCSCGHEHDILYDIDGRKIDYYDGPEIKRPIGWWCISPISHDYMDYINKWKVEVYPKQNLFKLYVIKRKEGLNDLISKYWNFIEDNLGISNFEIEYVNEMKNNRYLLRVIL